MSYYFAIPGWGRRLTSEVDGLKLYEVPTFGGGEGESQISARDSFFSTKDDNLGELISNVCVACVRGWAGVGACSAEGVGDGPNPAGGRLGHRSRSSDF